MANPRPWRLYRGVFADDRIIIGTFASHEAALRRAKELRAAGVSERGYRISGPAPLPQANDAYGWDRVRTYGLGRRWYEIV
jgi:hypothetical protein